MNQINLQTGKKSEITKILNVWGMGRGVNLHYHILCFPSDT